MMHTNRRWKVVEIGSAEELARMLSEQVWTLCSGFWRISDHCISGSFQRVARARKVYHAKRATLIDARASPVAPPRSGS